MLLILTATFLEQHFPTDNYLTPGTPSTGYLQVKKDQVSAMSGCLDSNPGGVFIPGNLSVQRANYVVARTDN